ncbi:ParB family protein [Pseudomonas sp. lyk4-TYG-107]|uniref:ParB family protein n=1 Tax=Pseudomonas sp. lyk4-TYG-107 TaxID=3040317 RepID=UPI0025540B6E|nr:ParB family protein [Pseudomonas sp. lyk4-TYG-107]
MTVAINIISETVPPLQAAKPTQITAAAYTEDPVTDTPMVVTLDQLKPYDLNPRVTRNPKYDEIKASILERGLDAPPPITRRPGEACYRVRNGGNTRLSILKELWTETKNDQFFRLACVFRPWPNRGEIVALTGHLAENELRGGLTFIERALGVEKARELYELESGDTLSQSELSRRLTADGYPVQQSHISRMRDAVEHLLPAIPKMLYGGLGRHQVERLAVMRRSFAKIWEEYARGKPLPIDFASLFHDALLMFDGPASELSIARVQDEIVGQMACYLKVDYDTLVLASESGVKREQVLATTSVHRSMLNSPPSDSLAIKANALKTMPPSSTNSPSQINTSKDPDRLQSIQALVAKHAGDEPVLARDVLPFTQGSLFPISDIWSIDPGLDEPQRLRIHISQFAREICQDAAKADLITQVDEGIGFRCRFDAMTEDLSPSSLLGLLEMLTKNSPSISTPIDIGPLLLGSDASQGERLSDANLVKLFRLIRLARRLIDHKSHSGPDTPINLKEDA